MWTAGNHLVLVAWVAVPPQLESDSGVRVFARALTRHTTMAGGEAARLVSDKWRRDVEKRGDDSVVAAAIAFERALQECNNNEVNVEFKRREEIRAAEPKENESKAGVYLLPRVPSSSRERQNVAGLVEGHTNLDATRVPALDEATNTALSRFRIAASNQSMADSLFVCQTPYSHGVSVAIVSSPAQVDEDLRPAHAAHMAMPNWQSAEQKRASMLERLRKFQRGTGPGA